jgi:DNA-binding FadR family transcriptional regulator
MSAKRAKHTGLLRIPKQSVVQEVSRQLEQRIFEGHDAPGEALPSEREIGESLGVSRTAVREAMARLERAGLVSIRQGGVTTVLDYRTHAGMDALPRLADAGRGDLRAEVVSAAIEMRAVLVPEVARRCAQRSGPDTGAALALVLEQMRRTDPGEGDLSQLHDLDREFWGVVVEGAGNIAYQLAFNSLRAIYDLIREAVTEGMADELRDRDGYRSILQAIDAHKPEAAEKATRAHIGLGLDLMLARFAAPSNRK